MTLNELNFFYNQNNNFTDPKNANAVDLGVKKRSGMARRKDEFAQSKKSTNIFMKIK